MVKYGIIQPLTGGVVCGAIDAFGYAPSWIISYPGLTDVKHDKSGNITSVGNEYNILKWLKDHDSLPPYQVFDKKPFQQTDLNVAIKDDPVWTTNKVDYSNTDLVISVPVCSGLSQATIAPQNTKDDRNHNMMWNAEFTLAKIQPKIYIFENAPTLFSDTGKQVRESLNELGKKYGYSVVYYKTDTQLHDNCQKRPRTFVLFIKHRGNDTGTPTFKFECKPVTVQEFFSRIPKNSTQQFPVSMSDTSKLCFDYIKHKFGSDYRDPSGRPWFIRKIIKHNLYDDACKFASESNYSQKAITSFTNLIRHVQKKVSDGKNFYCMLPGYTRSDSTIPAVMFKTIPTLLHYNEDRLYTIREYLHLMGMPDDYELIGNVDANYAKIGQNVPARTAQWIISEAIRILNNWDSIDRNNPEILFVDNIKQTVI